MLGYKRKAGVKEYGLHVRRIYRSTKIFYSKEIKLII